jgi:transposase-like protein
MATVTISEAARLAGISRTQLYRGFINKGKLSVIKENDKVAIDVSELLRVFPNATVETQLTQQEVAESNSDDTGVQVEIVTLLKDQLKKAEAQLAEAQERENWLKQQIDELRHQQNHLLEDKRVKPRKKFLGIF